MVAVLLSKHDNEVQIEQIVKDRHLKLYFYGLGDLIALIQIAETHAYYHIVQVQK